MRFHLFGLAEFPIRKEIVRCAFVPLIYNMAVMLKRAGYEVVFYGAAGSDVPCAEFVELVSEETLGNYNADKDTKNTYYGYDAKSTVWREFVERGRRGIRKRYLPRDISLISLGNLQRFVEEESELSCEFMCGYGGVFAKRKVFPSYAWMHEIYGELKMACNPLWNDAVIQHYIDIADFTATPDVTKEGYLLFVGRLQDDKGVMVAGDVAKAAEMTLVVSGTAPAGHSPDECIPKGSHVRYVGSCGHAKRARLMAGARALIAPTKYIEPFGMVAIEAMAYGTPAITTDWGGFTETVKDGVTGFRCRSLAEFVNAAKSSESISPIECRQWVRDRYSLEAVWPLYERYFRRLLDLYGKGWYALG